MTLEAATTMVPTLVVRATMMVVNGSDDGDGDDGSHSDDPDSR